MEHHATERHSETRRFKTLLLALGVVGSLASCSVESEKRPLETEFDRQIEPFAQFGEFDLVEAKDVADVRFHPILDATAMVLRGCQPDPCGTCPGVEDPRSIGVCPIKANPSQFTFCSRPVELHDDPEKECESTPLRGNQTLAQDAGTGLPINRYAVLTALHTLYGSKLADWRIVFGWRVRESGALDRPDVYHVRRIVACGKGDEKEDDWAILEVDRPMPSAAVLPQFHDPVSGDVSIDLNTRLVSAAYPHGTKLKFATDGRFLRSGETSASLFHHSIDTLSGFSGAPVFEADELALVGIIIEGAGERLTEVGRMCPSDDCCDYPVQDDVRCVALPICKDTGCCHCWWDSTAIRGAEMFAAIERVRTAGVNNREDPECLGILSEETRERPVCAEEFTSAAPG